MTLTALLTREPALNRKLAITANRIFIHARSTDEALATLSELQGCWPSTHPLFLSFGRLLPTEKLINAELWPKNGFLEIPLPALTFPAAQACIAKAQAQHLPLCLAWHDGQTVVANPNCWRFSIMAWEKSTQPGNAPGLVLAWGIPDAASVQQALESGFAGLCGWRSLWALASQGGNEPPAALRSTILQLLALLEQDAEVGEIEELFRRDVALGYRLLKYLNSAAMGLAVEITSFRHALNILGYRPLMRWLSVLLVHAHEHPLMPALAQMALTRARYLELLAAETFAEASEMLFLTGLFSALPLILRASPAKALEEIALPQAVYEAIAEGSGPFAPLLALAEASESASATKLLAGIETAGISALQHNRALLAAISFADAVNELA